MSARVAAGGSDNARAGGWNNDMKGGWGGRLGTATWGGGGIGERRACIRAPVHFAEGSRSSSGMPQTLHMFVSKP